MTAARGVGAGLVPYYDQDGITLYCGDAREVLPTLVPASVDLVLTDPPYPREYVDLYRTLAEESARVARPGAFVYAYAGAHELPEVIERMVPPLTWFWQFNIKHNGGAPRVWAQRLMVLSKPVIVCTNGRVAPDRLRWMATDHVSEVRDKAFHEWGQSIGFAHKQIEMRTAPGAVVLDPFMGGGTTIRAARNCGRRAIGIEIDEATCATVVQRLAQTVLPLEVG